MKITFNRCCSKCGTTYFSLNEYNNHSCVVEKKVIRAKQDNNPYSNITLSNSMEALKEKAKQVPNSNVEIKTDEEKQQELEISRMKAELNNAGLSSNTLNAEQTKKMYNEYKAKTKIRSNTYNKKEVK